MSETAVNPPQIIHAQLARHGMIQEAAYFRALSRGFAPGHELEDWLAAEAEVEDRAAKPWLVPHHTVFEGIAP